MKSQLINEFDAAKLLGISVKTIRAWRCHKRYNLNYYKIGGKSIRYSVDDIEEFLTSCAVSGGSD